MSEPAKHLPRKRPIPCLCNALHRHEAADVPHLVPVADRLSASCSHLQRDQIGHSSGTEFLLSSLYLFEVSREWIGDLFKVPSHIPVSTVALGAYTVHW